MVISEKQDELRDEDKEDLRLEQMGDNQFHDQEKMYEEKLD